MSGVRESTMTATLWIGPVGYRTIGFGPDPCRRPCHSSHRHSFFALSPAPGFLSPPCFFSPSGMVPLPPVFPHRARLNVVMPEAPLPPSPPGAPCPPGACRTP